MEQGLDPSNRQRVLALANALQDDLALVFISHHSGEFLPCLTHVLHLKQSEPPAFCGERRVWDTA